MCIQLHLESFYGSIKPKVMNDLGGHWSRKATCKVPKIVNDNFIGIE